MITEGSAEILLTFSDMNRMSGEARSLPNQRAFLREKFRNFSAHELVADWLVTVWVKLVGVAHIPRP